MEIYFTLALEQYRRTTQDQRPVSELPWRVLDQLNQDARSQRDEDRFLSWIKRSR